MALVTSPTEVEEAVGNDDGVDYAETSNDSDGIGASVLKEIRASVGRNRFLSKIISPLLRSVCFPM